MFGSTYSKLFIVSLVTLFLSACGSSGGSHSAPQAAAMAYNGYLVNATVWCDTNGDGVMDTGEQTTSTDEQGHYNFEPACDYALAATGGIVKTDTGNYPFSQTLQAPAGSKMISPLSNLLVVLTGLTNPATSANFTKDEALALIKKTLAVNGSVLTGDAVSQAKSGQNDLLNKNVIVQQLVKMLQSYSFDYAVKACVAEGIKSETQCKADVSASPRPVTAAAPPPGTLSTAILSLQAAWLDLANRLIILNHPLFTGIIINYDAIDIFMDVTAMEAAFGPCDFCSNGFFVNSTLQSLRSLSLDDLSSALAKTNGIEKPSNYLYLANNQITIHNTTLNVKTNTAFLDDQRGADIYYQNCMQTGTSLMGIYPDKLRFTVGHKGDLAQALPQGSSAIVFNLGEITDRLNSGARQLQVMVDKVNFSQSGGNLSLTVPNDASLYIYGRNTNGTTFNLHLKKSGSFFLSASGNTITVDYADLVTHLENSTQLNTDSRFDITELEQLEGNFNVALAVQNLNLFYANGSPLPLLTLGVKGAVNADTNSPIAKISGYGIQGRINLIDSQWQFPDISNCPAP